MIWRLLCSSALAYALAGCTEDGGEWEVWFQIDDATLAADGTDSTPISVIVLNGLDDPPELGTSALVTCFDSTSQPSGVLAASGSATATLQLDDIGQGATDFACSGDPEATTTVICIARYEGVTATGRPITCAP